jgi:zinc finger protein ubi-d4
MSEIKIVNFANLEKIAKFMNDSAYRDLIENSEHYNTKTNIERRSRRPFFGENLHKY